MKITDFIIPSVIAFVFIYGVINGVDVFDEFIKGAKDNLKTAVDIMPALIILMTTVGMFNASGALDVLTWAVSPITDALGFPKECLPLAFLRPLSGSGALAMYENIISNNAPDSYVNRVASVLLGSTETTFYTIAVYFGATKVKHFRHTVVAALSADITGFFLSAIIVRLMF